MIKDVFRFKKDNIFMKLLKWVYGVDTNSFSHICPFFWLSVLTLLFIVPICLFFTIRMVIVSIAKPVDYIARWVKEAESNRTKRIAKNIAEKMARDPLYRERILKKYKYNLYTMPSYLQAYIQYSGQLKDISKICKEFRERLKREDANKAVRNKERINAILRWGIPVSKFILYLSVLPILYTVSKYVLRFYNFIIHLHFPSFSMTVFMSIVDIVGWVILFSIIILFIVLVIAKNRERFLPYIPSIDVFRPVRWLWNGACMIVTIVVHIYRDSCPGLEWEE